MSAVFLRLDFQLLYSFSLTLSFLRHNGDNLTLDNSASNQKHARGILSTIDIHEVRFRPLMAGVSRGEQLVIN